MTRDDILVLAKAGFNAQQIAALASIQPKQEQAVQQEQPPVKQPEPTPPPAQEQKNPYDFEALLSRLDGMQAAIQKNAIMQSAQPETPEMTAESILAEIINPQPAKEV